VLVAAIACGPKLVRHTVMPGETLYGIGRTYGIDHRELSRVNAIVDPNKLEVGQRLLIPGAERVALIQPVPAAVPSRRRGPRSLPKGLVFHWPLASGRVTSVFGFRGAVHHDGIDIAAPRGTPVRCAAAGRVLFSDRLRGYGRLVIVDHGAGYATVYAHNTRNSVRVGAFVKAGHVIATVGESGQTSGPHLHFEIREDNVARDPMAYLSAPTTRRAQARRNPR